MGHDKSLNLNVAWKVVLGIVIPAILFCWAVSIEIQWLGAFPPALTLMMFLSMAAFLARLILGRQPALVSGILAGAILAGALISGLLGISLLSLSVVGLVRARTSS